LKQIGQQEGVSRERIRQIEAEAIRLMREALNQLNRLTTAAVIQYRKRYMMEANQPRRPFRTAIAYRVAAGGWALGLSCGHVVRRPNMTNESLWDQYGKAFLVRCQHCPMEPTGATP